MLHPDADAALTDFFTRLPKLKAIPIGGTKLLSNVFSTQSCTNLHSVDCVLDMSVITGELAFNVTLVSVPNADELIKTYGEAGLP